LKTTLINTCWAIEEKEWELEKKKKRSEPWSECKFNRRKLMRAYPTEVMSEVIHCTGVGL